MNARQRRKLRRSFVRRLSAAELGELRTFVKKRNWVLLYASTPPISVRGRRELLLWAACDNELRRRRAG